MTRMVPLNLLVCGVWILNGALYFGLPGPLSSSYSTGSLVSVTGLLLSMAIGSGLGLLNANWIARNLERTGVSRLSRRELLLRVAAIAFGLTIYILLISFGLVITSLVIAWGYTCGAAAFAVQSAVYLRWEHRTGRKIESEGLWAVKAVGP